MRIVFFGTPDFAVASLQALVEAGENVVAVVTAPDKPAGRGQKTLSSAVKQYALSQGLPVLQPEKLKDPEFLQALAAFQADLQIIVAFRMLPEVVWNMPPKGTFNLHASLLPNFRGAAPIHWAIIHGEKETGVSTFFLQHEIDTGDLIFQEKEPIHPDDTTGTLYDRLMHKGAALVVKTVQAIAKNQVQPIPQDVRLMRFQAPKIHKALGELDWTQSGKTLEQLIRGLNPSPSAYTHYKGMQIKIHKAEVKVEQVPHLQPGAWASDQKNHIYIGTGDGYLSILEIQLEGKKRLEIKEFLKGFQV